MSFARQTITSLGWMISSSYLNSGIAFLGNLLLAYLLLPRDFGIFSFASSLLLLVFMFAGFGSQEAIIQCRDDSIKHLIPTSFWISIIIAFILAILGTAVGLISYIQYDSHVSTIIICLSWINVVSAVSQCHVAILKREMRYRPVAFAKTGGTFGSFAVAVIVALLGGTYWALVVRQAVFVFWGYFAFRYYSQYRLRFTVDIEAAKWIWQFGWKLMASRITEVFLERGDKLLIGTFLGQSILGHYTLAYRLSLTGTEFTQGAISSVTHSLYATVQHSTEKLRLSLERTLFWLGYVTPILGIIGFLIGREVVIYIYGQKWTTAAEIFQNMAPLLGVLPLRENLRYFLVGSNHVGKAVKVLILQAIFMLVSITGVLLSGHGVISVTWCINAGLLLSFGGMVYYTNRIVKINWVQTLIFPISCSLIAGTIGYVISIPAAGLLAVGLRCIVTICMYLIIVFLFQRKALWNEFRLARLYIR